MCVCEREILCLRACVRVIGDGGENVNASWRSCVCARALARLCVSVCVDVPVCVCVCISAWVPASVCVPGAGIGHGLGNGVGHGTRWHLKAASQGTRMRMYVSLTAWVAEPSHCIEGA